MNKEVEINELIFTELRLAVGKEFIKEMIDTFCEDSPKQIAILKKAFTENEPVDFMRAAHTLKSTSLIFGAMKFGELARELEHIGRTGSLTGSEEKIGSLCDSLDQLKDVLKELCHE